MKGDAHVVHFPHSTLAIDHPLSPATGRQVLPVFHELSQTVPKAEDRNHRQLAAMKKAGAPVRKTSRQVPRD
jgi:hypothetical protein